MAGKVVDLYNLRVNQAEIEPDWAQRSVAERFDRLAAELSARGQEHGGLFSLLFRSRGPSPRGVYVYGGVGRGKTMLVNLFHEVVAFEPKRRLHFHEFMAEAHERIARGRATTDGDPIPFVASEIAAASPLLCLDELQVTDIADAMILGRLFKVLFERGVVMVMTSNANPASLYENGLNRQLFLPFIDLIEAHLDVLELKSAKDFRLDKLAGRKLYFSPSGGGARAELDKHWDRLTGHHPGGPVVLEVKGRKIQVPLASMGVARFGFADLCEQPLGPLDYLRIAHEFHTVLIDDLPVLAPTQRNEVRRLISLIDTLYDNRVCLIASAEAEPHLLYPSGAGAKHFERTVSRLMEMRSEAYLAKRPVAPVAEPA
jgi:cell division protein ZapE